MDHHSEPTAMPNNPLSAPPYQHTPPPHTGTQQVVTMPPSTPPDGAVATPLRGPPPPSQIATVVSPPTIGKSSRPPRKNKEKLSIDDLANQLWIPKSITDMLNNIL